MARLSFSSNGDSHFQHLLGHNPEILKRWNELENAFFYSETFSAELKGQGKL